MTELKREREALAAARKTTTRRRQVNRMMRDLERFRTGKTVDGGARVYELVPGVRFALELTPVLLDSVLWVATDLRDAERQIDRAQPDSADALPGLSGNEAFLAARATWSDRDRIQGFIDVERVTTLGLLSPESDVEELAKGLLLDLRNHPSVAFTARSEADGARILLDVTALLRRSLRDR